MISPTPNPADLTYSTALQGSKPYLQPYLGSVMMILIGLS